MSMRFIMIEASLLSYGNCPKRKENKIFRLENVAENAF